MTEANEFALNETEIFAEAVSDEALEAAARWEPARAAALTVAMCTGLDVCPF